MSVKLGIAPIAWSNDDMPELGGDTSLEQCLSEASQAGFIGIESGGKFPKKSEDLIPKLNEFNLNLCSGWYGANLRINMDAFEKIKLTSTDMMVIQRGVPYPILVPSFPIVTSDNRLDYGKSIN